MGALRDRISASIQYVILVLVAGIFALVAIGFFISALYVWLADQFGRIEASLIVGGGFVVLAIIMMLVGAGMRRAAANRLKRQQDRLFVQPASVATAMISHFIGPKQTAVMMLVALVAGYLAARPRHTSNE
jgi:hypothetical protein